MDEKIEKQRDSNLELFRIITMLLIVAHHYVVNSGLMEVIRGGGTTVWYYCKINLLSAFWSLGENRNKLFCTYHRLFYV